MIGNLKREVSSLQDIIQEKEKEVYTEKDAFQRLYESYMILQHHNEENLTLRLATEEKLKHLFKRDRQHEFRVKKAEKVLKDERGAIKDVESTFDELNEEIKRLKNVVIEKDGMHHIINQEMQA